MTSISLITSALPIVFIQLMTTVVCRQMCYTCQYVQNGPGLECASAPLNWTGGVIRMRCPTMCTIIGEYSSDTGKPTFFYRGCAAVTPDQKNGCQEDGARHTCFFFCGGKEHDYCNNQAIPISPLMGKKDENEKDPRNGSIKRSLSSCAMAHVLILFFLILIFTQN